MTQRPRIRFPLGTQSPGRPGRNIPGSQINPVAQPQATNVILWIKNISLASEE